MEEQWLPLIRSHGVLPVYATPLPEVFSISLSPNSFAECETCEVYGEINIIDEDGTSYELYSLDSEDTETISVEDNTLAISVPKECILSSTWSRLTIHLTNGTDDTLIVDCDVKLDKLTPSYYDKVKILTLNGPGGSACVKYTTFFAAVLVYVDVVIDKKERFLGIDNILDNDKGKVDVYGTIIAHYKSTNGGDGEFPGTMLFEEQSDGPYSLEFSQTPINLSRVRVVVPAYSFFRVDIQLCNSHSHETFANGSVDFLPYFQTVTNKFMEGDGFLVQVKTRWYHPYDMGQLRRSPEVVPEREHFGTDLIEVFGVMICHNVNGVVKICGKVVVEDGDWMLHEPFNRSVSFPAVLSSNRESIPVEGPLKCYVGHDGFTMQLDLWDVQGEALVKSDLTWRRRSPLFCDRRICVVSLGVNCYACVFFSMFSTAVQARITVHFVPTGVTNGVHEIYGSIVASYSNEDYSSEYAKSNYKSIVFNSSESSVKLVRGGNVPLLKSVIAVPTSSSLLIETDLKVVYETFEENLKNVAIFDFKEGVLTRPILDGSTCIFKLSVEWSSACLTAKHPIPSVNSS